MIKALDEAVNNKRRGAFSVRKTTFKVKASPDGITVDSWRMQDWDYKKPDLPTYARGLFTTKTKNNQSEIAIRGYDKFFNVDEVAETRWNDIVSQTQGPYELTLKENGCIIFVAGLEDDTLLVCSKHSTGERSDIQVSHSSAGELRLEQQLAAIGKSKAELARDLRARNVTAVAELCDDTFEEHILAYGPDKAGLYLHGINLNVPEFATYPSGLVQDFAEQWGFHRTGLIVMNDIHEVKNFLADVAQTGAHDGRDVEGFVVRCRMSHSPNLTPHQDWFFKYKFEEPYLMFRQWRECTKALINGKPPKFKKHAKITEEYLLYARKRLAEDATLGKLYNQNHGIIALRDDFLKFKNLKGSDAANMDDTNLGVVIDVAEDVILCPIATIGCGKTTIALGLSHLFGWGHVQNDNISGKGRPPRFTKAVLDQLEHHPAVLADRNNAQRHERKQIITDVKLQHKSAKIVCLNFRHDGDAIDEIRRVTTQRVIERGDNHQTIHAATDEAKFIGVMNGFLNRFEACNPLCSPDSSFDAVIDLDPAAGSRQNLETIVSQLHKMFPNLVKEMPNSVQLDDAFSYALEYQPDFKHTIPDRTAPERKKNKKPQLEYMAVDMPSSEVNAILEKTFSGTDPQISRFYEQLKQTRRVQPKFHITLMHRASAKDHPDLWRRYTSLFEAAGSGEAKLRDIDVIFERVCSAA